VQCAATFSTPSRVTARRGRRGSIADTSAEACLAAYNEFVPKDKQKTLLDLKK